MWNAPGLVLKVAESLLGSDMRSLSYVVVKVPFLEVSCDAD